MFDQCYDAMIDITEGRALEVIKKFGNLGSEVESDDVPRTVKQHAFQIRDDFFDFFDRIGDISNFVFEKSEFFAGALRTIVFNADVPASDLEARLQNAEEAMLWLGCVGKALEACSSKWPSDDTRLFETFVSLVSIYTKALELQTAPDGELSDTQMVESWAKLWKRLVQVCAAGGRDEASGAILCKILRKFNAHCKSLDLSKPISAFFEGLLRSNKLSRVTPSIMDLLGELGEVLPACVGPLITSAKTYFDMKQCRAMTGNMGVIEGAQHLDKSFAVHQIVS